MTGPSTRALIGTPTYSGQVYTAYVKSLLGSAAHLGKYPVGLGVNFLRGSLVSVARNYIVRNAIEGGFSHLMIADSDMAWPPDAVMRLLSWGKDAVGAVCQSRQDGRFCVFNPRPVPGEAPLLEVDSIGTGFLLLSRACLVRMMEAYPGRAFEILHGGEDDPGVFTGEDTAFCDRWRAMGGRVFADPTFRMSHFGERDWNASFPETLAADGGAICGPRFVSAAELADVAAPVAHSGG